MPEGLGYGIGKGLEQIGEGLTRRFQNQYDDRERQADALHEKGLKIAQNLQQYAMDTPDPTAIQFAGKSYKPEAGPLIEQLQSTSEQVRGLFGPHETPALVQHFRKFLGKSPKLTTPNPRAAQYSPEGFVAEVPQTPDKFLADLQSFRKALRQSNPNITSEQEMAAVNEHLGVKRDASADWKETGQPFAVSEAEAQGRKPGVYQQVTRTKDGKVQSATEMRQGIPKSAVTQDIVPKENKWDTSPISGGPLGVFDPNTGKHYDANTITTAPPELQGEWKSKEDYAAKLNAQKETAELKKVQDAEAREDRRFANQSALQAKAFENAFSQKDYATANQIKKDAETKYTDALSLSSFADDALAHHSAAKDKMLAGRMIRVSEGRFNPQQYDNLVKNAGLANTFDQWMNNVETGELTPLIRKQLVDVAHSLLSAADAARKSIEIPETPSRGTLKEKAKPKNGDPVDDIVNELQKLKP